MEDRKSSCVVLITITLLISFFGGNAHYKSGSIVENTGKQHRNSTIILISLADDEGLRVSMSIRGAQHRFVKHGKQVLARCAKEPDSFSFALESCWMDRRVVV